ncbi:MAG TPA: helix-turn-helix transcriptional regulator [Gemmatimonadales bacterium]|jgi:DNA-binding PadR family transcriptional regulator
MGDGLGEFEQLVLLALVRLGDGAYGMIVHRELEQRARREVTLGAVYKTLARLEAKGLVGAFTGEPTPERGGRRKRHYRVLPEGRRALARSLATIRRMSVGLPEALELS